MIMTVLFLALGELATGTDPRFVLMMCIAMLSIAATYNLLGGVSTFSGILLAGFALRTIVISQFAKVLLFERADQNLNSPQLTITVYAVFYFMMLVGVFLFGRFRLHMPKTLEMETLATKRTAYILAFPLGLVGTLLYEMNSQMYSTSVSSQFGPLHSIGVALSPLLLLALVLSVDIMIEKSGGRSSVGWTTIAPAVILVGCAMADTVRTSVLVPAIAYILTCYLRGYHFRAKHYAYFALAMFLFTWIVSPLGIYVRGFTQTSDMRFFQRVSAVFKVAMSYSPAELASFTSTVAEMDLHEQYFNARGTFVLSRLSLIRADSNLIEACSSGFHYGLAEIKEQISKDLPSFMIKNKSRIPENNYIANISGLGVDSEMAQPVRSVSTIMRQVA